MADRLLQVRGALEGIAARVDALPVASRGRRAGGLEAERFNFALEEAREWWQARGEEALWPKPFQINRKEGRGYDTTPATLAELQAAALRVLGLLSKEAANVEHFSR